MRIYELTCVLPGGVSAAKKKSLKETIEKIVKAVKGEIKENKDWGEIELAYPIKKEDTGVFLHFVLELDSAAAEKILKKLRIEGDIIRYLLVRRD